MPNQGIDHRLDTGPGMVAAAVVSRSLTRTCCQERQRLPRVWRLHYFLQQLQAENSRLKADVANLESLVKARTEQVQVTLRELKRS